MRMIFKTMIRGRTMPKGEPHLLDVDVNRHELKSLEPTNKPTRYPWDEKESTLPPRLARKKKVPKWSSSEHTAPLHPEMTSGQTTPTVLDIGIPPCSEVTTKYFLNATLPSCTTSPTIAKYSEIPTYATIHSKVTEVNSSETAKTVVLVGLSDGSAMTTTTPPISPPQVHSQPQPQPMKPTPAPSAAGPSKIKRRRGAKVSLRPQGPRHLEYDYHVALEGLKEAVYDGFRQLGCIPPKSVIRQQHDAKDGGDTPNFEELTPGIKEKLKAIPTVVRASRKLDEADLALEEALARGETWDNTPVPAEFRWGHPSLEGVEFMRDEVVIENSKKKSKRARATSSKRRARSQNETIEDTQVLTPTQEMAKTPTVTTSKIEEVHEDLNKDVERSVAPSVKEAVIRQADTPPSSKKRKAESALEVENPTTSSRPKRACRLRKNPM